MPGSSLTQDPFKPNDVLRTPVGKYTVVSKIGAGGQGFVFRVRDEAGRPLALKWYFDASATPRQKRVIENLIVKGAPSDCFLWPQDLVERDSRFGYVMPLRPSQYVSLLDVVRRTVEVSFSVLVLAAYQMTSAFRQLHTSGLSYCDISFTNIFIDPETGRILICDNDNVSASGGEDSGVLGTEQFMAPELQLGQTRPNTYTDRYSLAILLFYLLCLSDPLDGKNDTRFLGFDQEAKRFLYVTHPVFIFNPSNRSNAPIPGIHDNALIYWPLYPDEIQHAFIRTFTDGIRDTSARTTEGEWLKALGQLISSLIHCPKCGAEIFYLPNRQTKCWHCRSVLPPQPVLRIGQLRYIPEADKPFYAFQAGEDSQLFSSILGEVVRHPKNPSVLGLRNHTDHTWTCKTAGETTNFVPPGKACVLRKGTEIRFGQTTGVIE